MRGGINEALGIADQKKLKSNINFEERDSTQNKFSSKLPFISTLSPKAQEIGSDYNPIKVNNQLQRLLSSDNDRNSSLYQHKDYQSSPEKFAQRMQPTFPQSLQNPQKKQNLGEDSGPEQFKLKQRQQVQSFQFQDKAHQQIEDSIDGHANLQQAFGGSLLVQSPKGRDQLNSQRIQSLAQVSKIVVEGAQSKVQQEDNDLKLAKRQLLQGIESRRQMMSQLNSNLQSQTNQLDQINQKQNQQNYQTSSYQNTKDRNQSALLKDQKYHSLANKKQMSLEIADSYRQGQSNNEQQSHIQMDSFLMFSPSNNNGAHQYQIQQVKKSNHINTKVKENTKVASNENVESSLLQSSERQTSLSGGAVKRVLANGDNIASLNDSSIQNSSNQTNNTSFIVSLPFIKASKDPKTGLRQSGPQMNPSNYGQSTGMTFGMVGPLGLGTTGFKELGISQQENEVKRQYGRVSATPADESNSLHIIDEQQDRRRLKMVIQSDSTFQKVKVKKKQQLTQRQLVQAAIIERNNESIGLNRNEKFLNNLHSNLTINGQKQEIITSQSPEPNEVLAAKKRLGRQIAKSQEPNFVMAQQQEQNQFVAQYNTKQQVGNYQNKISNSGVGNSQGNTYRLVQVGQQDQQFVQNEKQIVKTQYNHHFSNIKNSARGSQNNILPQAQESLIGDNKQTASNDYQFNQIQLGAVPFNERREALRNKFHQNQFSGKDTELQDKNFSINAQNYDESIIQELRIQSHQSPIKEQQSYDAQTQHNANYAIGGKYLVSAKPYENLIQRSNIIITEKGSSNPSTLPTGLSFASPSLEYRKKKRDYNPQSTNQPKYLNQVYPLSQMQAHQQYISLSKANQLINVASDVKSQLLSNQQKNLVMNSSNINQLVHQLNMNRIGNPHLSFAQVLKNMNSKVSYNQVPVTSIDTFENIRKDFTNQLVQQHQKALIQEQREILMNDPSQEQIEAMTLAAARASSLERVELNPLISGIENGQVRQHQLAMSSEKKRSQVQIKKNSDLMQGAQAFSHIQKRKNSFSQNSQLVNTLPNNQKLLNADELYDMAKKLKKQSKLKQGVADYQQLQQLNMLQQMQMQSQSFNRSQDNIQQQQNLLGYLNQRASLGLNDNRSKPFGVLATYNHISEIPGALNIQRLRTKQVKQDIDTYQLQQKDMQLIQKYSKKGQNLLSSSEENHQYQSQALAEGRDGGESRNQRSQLQSSKSLTKDIHNKSIHAKVNQSADFGGSQGGGGMLSGNNNSDAHLMSIQEIQPILRSEDKRNTAQTTIRENKANRVLDEKQQIQSYSRAGIRDAIQQKLNGFAGGLTEGADSVAEADSQEEGNTSMMVKPGFGSNIRNNNFQQKQFEQNQSGKPIQPLQQKGWQTNKAKKQQELRNQDLDKLMYGYLWEKEQKQQALNPSNKKKADIPFFADLVQPAGASSGSADDFLTHPINKTLKQMTALSNLMFRTKEYGGGIQMEILNRCTRYFSIPIPKQYKGELAALMKSKEFLTLAKEKMHLMMFATINKANQITPESESSQQAQPQPKYIIGAGNNHMLVKSVFKTRQWWVQSEKESFEECSFIWTQWLKDRHIQSLVPLEKRNQSSNNQDPQEENLHVTRLYNKMQGNYNLSDKKHLFQNMREYYTTKRNMDPFKVLPLTFVVENGLNDIEFDKFERHFNRIAQQSGLQKQVSSLEGTDDNMTKEEDGKENNNKTEEKKGLEMTPKPRGNQMENVWIIKPGEDTNRGSGIIVSKDFNEIKQLVRDKASRGVDKTAIIQKYIENPLLINKRKFDIRCYGMLTSINGNLMGYYYNDGYIRTSCKEFSVQNLSNKFIHLTNDAIQKFSDDYGKFENANKLSFQDFDKYFENNGEFDLKFTRDFLPQIRAIIRDSFDAVSSKIDPERRLNSFEIFGYDFMITDNFELKLIEANTNPSIEICCPLLARIVPNLLDSAFKIAIDPLFPPPPNKKALGAWGSGNEILNELKFELVYQAPNSDQQAQAVNSQIKKQSTSKANSQRQILE